MQRFSFLYGIGLTALIAALFFAACRNKTGPVNESARALVKDSVAHLADNIARAVSAKGPAAWLDYFENDPGFFMASGGAGVFGNYEEARSKIIKSINKAFSKIHLTWNNYNIDPLTNDYASFGADFKEDIVLVSKQQMTINGYVTALLHFDGARWKIRNMNWAIRQEPAASK